MEKKRPLKVYGHHFNSDTRTVLTLLDISGVNYEFEEVDIFQGKHQDAGYLEKNPTGSIPMIVDDGCQLIGNTSVFANYLTLTKPKLQSYRPKEHASKIEQHLNWFTTVLRPCIQRLIKVIVGPKAFGHSEFTGEQVEAAKQAFFSDILHRVNAMLENRQFLISASEPTVVDIVFYNEISSGLMLTRIKGFKRMFPQVDAWVTNMGEIGELETHAEKMVELID